MKRERTAVVVEDDHDVGAAISGLLAQAGFDVVVASTGGDALAMITERRPDLVTLDLSLPDIDGVEVCRQVRTLSDCYVIMVSGRDGEVDRLTGLDVGADDYLVKPFSLRELQARVAAVFRRPRTGGHEPEPVPVPAEAPVTPPAGVARVGALGCDDLTLDRHARAVLVSGTEITLTRTEFDMLLHLVSNPGVVVGREDLVRAVWATDFVPGNTHVLDVHLANLRRKLRAAASDNQWIRTIRGVGFRFDPCCS